MTREWVHSNPFSRIIVNGYMVHVVKNYPRHWKGLFAVIVAVAEERMSYFVAGLTNDDPNITAPVFKQYHHVQYNETLPISATGSVSFPPSSDVFRYVIIQQQFDSTNAICLAEVKVFLRGTENIGFLLCGPPP